MQIDILPRTVLSFFVLLMLTGLLGKPQLSQLIFNYITGITFGNIAAELASDKSISTTEGLGSLVLWTGLTVFVEFISLKSGTIRRIFNSEPTVLIKKGKYKGGLCPEYD